ncbi:MAG: hypothetical protein JO034_23765 [Singulisphaera sp.]|nr:hypothetical protein [Singulisphaera sp.]
MKAATIATVALVLTLLAAPGPRCLGQEPVIERPPPPAVEDFETDANKDGIPDGWYNARDVKLVSEGGPVGPHCLRFEVRKPGRPARLSRAFGVDGSKTEALVVGLWVRLDQVSRGERLGEEPGLPIDFLGDELRELRRGLLGPWNRSVGTSWTRVAKRVPVPPGTRDAIMSIGLLGATGVLEVDGLTIDLIPRGGSETTNLIVNGDFELGDPDPASWMVDGGAHRSSPGLKSDSALVLARPGARAMTGLAIPVEPFPALDVRIYAKGQGLRGAGGASARLFFLDDFGAIVPDPVSGQEGSPVVTWSGTFDWRPDHAVIAVPRKAVRAVLQVEKLDANGTVRIDRVAATAAPDPAAGAWVPFHVEDDTSGWDPVRPSATIAEKSALDASYLLDAPAGRRGFVTVRDGRLGFTKGGRARFFGACLLPPTAFLEPKKADALADRLARSGINLVRFGELDTPIGPDRSLYDDSRDDTKAFDPIALAKLDHLIAALKARGIYVALELLSARRYRSEDGVADVEQLPLGGGPAAAFDSTLGQLALESARALLEHVNPETGLALRDDPVLAWVTLAGRLSLFNQIEDPHGLTPHYAESLRKLAAQSPAGAGRRFWQAVESEHWKEMAEALRRDKVRVPIAGVSHWRREPEFSAAQAAAGLDMIDDRLYWGPPSWISPEYRSLLWSPDGGLAAGAAPKRKPDRPYAVGQWCNQTQGAWAFRFEAADLLLGSQIALAEDWDALVRRGVFLHPRVWGSNATGTGGGEDIFQIPEVVNGTPQIFALWPHAASILLRGHKAAASNEPHPAHRPAIRSWFAPIPGWDPMRGRLVIDTPYTQGIAGWPGGEPANFAQLKITTDEPFAVVVASSAGREPIATSKRLLVSALARVEPTDYRWVDEWKHDVADPGLPPLLQEPLRAKVLWRHKGPVKAFALDNTGARIAPATLEETPDGFALILDGKTPSTIHRELVAE